MQAQPCASAVGAPEKVATRTRRTRATRSVLRKTSWVESCPPYRICQGDRWDPEPHGSSRSASSRAAGTGPGRAQDRPLLVLSFPEIRPPPPPGFRRPVGRRLRRLLSLLRERPEAELLDGGPSPGLDLAAPPELHTSSGQRGGLPLRARALATSATASPGPTRTDPRRARPPSFRSSVTRGSPLAIEIQR